MALVLTFSFFKFYIINREYLTLKLSILFACISAIFMIAATDWKHEHEDAIIILCVFALGQFLSEVYELQKRLPTLFFEIIFPSIIISILIFLKLLSLI